MTQYVVAMPLPFCTREKLQSCILVSITCSPFLSVTDLTFFYFFDAQLYRKFPNLHVYTYGALPCVDLVVADACSEFVTR